MNPAEVERFDEAIRRVERAHLALSAAKARGGSYPARLEAREHLEAALETLDGISAWGERFG
jgi:hypothetical protein